MHSPSKRDDRDAAAANGQAAHKRRMEIYAFLIITAVLMPALTVATVGAWGLTVWVYQAIHGPPGPPSK